MECGNLTTLIEPTIHVMTKQQSLGRKMYAARQDYVLDYVAGTTWSGSAVGSAASGYTVPFDTFAA